MITVQLGRCASARASVSHHGPKNTSPRLQLLLATGKGSSVIRRLAYDAVAIASLNHDDWAHICQALGHDLTRGQVAEVQLRALELVAAMPELHVQRLMEEGKLEDALLDFVADVRL